MISSKTAMTPDISNSSPAAETLWFYADASNQTVGPVPLSELERLAAAGVIQSGTQVIENGASEWRAFSEVAPRTAPPPLLPLLPSAPAPRRWPTILALVFLYPVGLVLLWRSKLFTKRIKVLVTVIATPFFLSAFAENFRKSRHLHDHEHEQGQAAEAEVLQKPKIFQRGAKVVIAKGSTVYGDAELLAELSQATREKNEAVIESVSEKLAPKTGQVGENSIFTVLEPIQGGAFYKLEGGTADGGKQIWCAAYADMTPYVSPEEKKARAEIAARDAKIAKDRAEIESTARDILNDALVKVEVNRITGGPYEGLYNVELRMKDGGFWSDKTAKDSIERLMKKAYERLFAKAPRIWNVWCVVETKLIDKYGKESMEVVYKTSMTKETADKINWQNSALLDFSSLWETHFLHPVLAKE
jgi:hypothetical protein